MDHPTGESILRTLIELLEAQEQIKISYEIKEKGGIYNVKDRVC